MTTDQENVTPIFFTASNGLTVQRLGVNRFRARGPYGSDVERGIVQGESTLRALVEYAASIGITAEGNSGD